MVYGTSYFPTRGDADKYYHAQGFFSFQVDNKIEDGEIHIGKPPGLHSLRQAVLHESQGGSQRYFIHEVQLFHEDRRVG
jgi:hypothetical protein